MLRGCCLDAETLSTDILFYLLSYGKHNYYASRLPREGSHTGSTRGSIFHRGGAGSNRMAAKTAEENKACCTKRLLFRFIALKISNMLMVK